MKIYLSVIYKKDTISYVYYIYTYITHIQLHIYNLYT